MTSKGTRLFYGIVSLGGIVYGTSILKLEWDNRKKEREALGAFEREFVEFKKKGSASEAEAVHLVDSFNKMTPRHQLDHIKELRNTDSVHLRRRVP
jgi:hypothetical protein